MFNQIRTSEGSETHSEDAVDLLIACHERIRHFSSVAVKLSQTEGVAPQEISSAAASVHRYYSVSLPLHEADEEQTLRPRLTEVADERVRRAAVAMSEQHQAIEALVERLLPLLLLVQSNPASWPDVREEMSELATMMQEMFDAHLKLEEQEIFPAIRGSLPETVRKEMLREMTERRESSG